MNKLELLKLAKSFNVSEIHSAWADADEHNSIELCKLMGSSSPIESVITMFSNIEKFGIIPAMELSNYGSLYLTAKRILYKHLNNL